MASNIDDYELMTDNQISKWKNLKHVHETLSSINKNIKTTNAEVLASKIALDERLHRSEYLLKPKTYDIVFLGGSGMGKSTILNTLIENDYLPTGQVTSVTGTIIFIEVIDDSEPEKAIVHYNEPEDLKKHVKELAELGKIEDIASILAIFDSPNPDNDSFDQMTTRLNKLYNDLTYKDNDKGQYIKIIMDIVNSYKIYCKKKQEKTLFRSEFLIPTQLDSLEYYINEAERYYENIPVEEFSKNSTDRIIRLISHVTFYIHPPKHTYIRRLLKKGIRIVDVPGFGSKNPIHEIITKNFLRNLEPMFAIVVASDRLADPATRSVLTWLKTNYLEAAGEDESFKRALSESVFIIVNNKTGEYLVDRNKTMTDNVIEEEISENLYPKYLHHFSGRGQNADSYIIVTPLPAMYLQKKYNTVRYNRVTDNKLKGDYNTFIKSLPRDNRVFSDPDVKDKCIMGYTGIPHLSDQILYFLENRRVDVQIEQAYDQLKRGWEDLGNSILKIIGKPDLKDPNLMAMKKLNHKKVNFKKQLDDIEKKLFDEFGSDYVSVEPFVKVFSVSLTETLTDLKQRIKKFDVMKYDVFRVVRDPITGREIVETTPGRLGIAVDSEFQQQFRVFAENFAEDVMEYFKRVLDDAGIKSQLINSTYNKKYSYKLPITQPGSWAYEEVEDIEIVYNSYIDTFKKDYIQAFKIMMTYELLRDEECSAFYQICIARNKNTNSNSDNANTENISTDSTLSVNRSIMQEELTEISNQIRETLQKIEVILDNSSQNPLFKGLRKHFFYMYASLKDNLEETYNTVINYHQATLAKDDQLVKEILEIDNEYEDERARLSKNLETLNELRSKFAEIR